MTLEYNIPSDNFKSAFDITQFVEFDAKGRALCPACSHNHKSKSRTLSLVPGTDGAYKCFRGCTSEEIRDALGQPKSQFIPTALYKETVPSKKVKATQPTSRKTNNGIVDETKVVKAYSELMSLKGTALDAIQYLANSALNLNQPGENQASYTIELNGYRVGRQAEIRHVATSAANEVRTSGREVEIQSLSSAERRQVHTYLRNYTDLETFSRGKEPNRNLVVRLAVQAADR